MSIRRICLPFFFYLLCAQEKSVVGLDAEREFNNPQPHVRHSPLRMTKDNQFKIIQFADLHFGECPDTDWGPQQDEKTKVALSDILTWEAPHLAILSGDQLTGLNIDDNATTVWDSIVQVIDQTGTPHTAILGNHDAEPHSGQGGMDEPGAKTNRTQLMQHDRSLPLSYSGVAPVSLQPAASTYVVDVYSALPPSSVLESESEMESDMEIPVLQLIHMDSGGGGMPEDISHAQVEWFKTLIKQRRDLYQKKVPVLIFIHIPFKEFTVAWQEGSGEGQQCWGVNEDGVSPVTDDGGLFAAINETDEAVGVFVGHNHCNDFCCNFSTKKLCFGRHSSYGGYNCNGYLQGARVIDVSIPSTALGDNIIERKFTDATDLQILTHVRLINGDIIHEGSIV